MLKINIKLVKIVLRYSNFFVFIFKVCEIDGLYYRIVTSIRHDAYFYPFLTKSIKCVHTFWNFRISVKFFHLFAF